MNSGARISLDLCPVLTKATIIKIVKNSSHTILYVNICALHTAWRQMLLGMMCGYVLIILVIEQLQHYYSYQLHYSSYWYCQIVESLLRNMKDRCFTFALFALSVSL